MGLRFRLLGALIIACGLAVCYGATAIWPGMAVASWQAVGLLRAIGAAIVALVGVLNLLAGFAVLALKPARE